MVNPGTGAGLQAQAMRELEGVVNRLMEIGGKLGGSHPAFNAIATSIKALSGAANKAEKNPQTHPLPIPQSPTGAGLGGAPRPPTGVPSPNGSPMGGASPNGGLG